MAKFLIAGSIVDADADKATFEDLTPTQFNSFIKGLGEGEALEIDITSYGGSVPAGLAICNMLKMASGEGHKTTAHVVGIAASMASAIACACDELKIDSNSFLMIHNPWTYAMGDADDMRKEAETLDKMRDALVAIYRSKFDLDDEAIKKMMDSETWISGADAETFKLKAEIIQTEEPLKAAAFAGKSMPKFLHVPQTISDLITSKVDATAEEPTAEAKPVEAEVEEAKGQVLAKFAAYEARIAELEELAKPGEVEKRVSGMQSAMQAQINDLKKDYEARITDFENQLKVRDEELATAKAEATRLAADLESEKTAHAELSEKTSALESALAEKTETLAKLNAAVLTPAEELPTMKAGLAKCATAAERVAFLKSGKYTK